MNRRNKHLFLLKLVEEGTSCGREVRGGADSGRGLDRSETYYKNNYNFIKILKSENFEKLKVVQTK